MFLICGLGNPGKKYLNTRHNIGFVLVEKLIDKYDFKISTKDKRKEIYQGKILNKKSLIVKPLTYMNLSGIAIQEVLNYYKISSLNLFVIHDDLDLQTAKVKVKLGGGNGGHNGLLSIDEKIGKNYNRIRIGIHHPGSKELVSKYVLKKFTKDENIKIKNKINKICDFFEILLKDKNLFLTRISE